MGRGTWSTLWISHQRLLCWFEDLHGQNVGLCDGLGFAMAYALLRNNLKALLFLSLLHPQLAGGAGQQPQQQQQPGLPAQGLQEEGDQVLHRALVREKREGSLDSAEQRRGHGAGSVSSPIPIRAGRASSWARLSACLLAPSWHCLALGCCWGDRQRSRDTTASLGMLRPLTLGSLQLQGSWVLVLSVLRPFLA